MIKVAELPGKMEFRTNLDTNFIKIIAVVTMLIDHIGAVFFPSYLIFRLIGRIAFPLFCYCITVGMVYTRDIGKYLLRLAIFALISQPCVTLAFHYDNFLPNLLYSYNVFFSLLLGLLGVWGLRKGGWWILLWPVAFAILGFGKFDYNALGLLYMTVFYLCRKKKVIGGLLTAFLMAAPSIAILIAGGFTNLPCYAFTKMIWTGNSPYQVGGLRLDLTVTTLLALPFIYIPTRIYPKLNRILFYWIYPAHLLLFGLINLLFLQERGFMQLVS